MSKKKKKSAPAPKKPESFFEDEQFMKIFAVLLFLNLLATSYLLLDNFGYSLF